QTPERNMIRNSRRADRAEKDRIMIAQPADAGVRHHLAGFAVRLTGAVKVTPAKLDAERGADSLQCPKALGYDLIANTVAGNNCDLVSFHRARILRDTA